jgi:uncharacterized protein (TIGR03437 family)
MSKLARAMSYLTLIAALPAGAQTWDNSGNSKLNGSYNFRQVLYLIGDQNGDLSEAAALYGTINFNGSGTYSFSATMVDSSTGTATFNQNGTYTISASGYGFLSNPLEQILSSSNANDFIYGLVSNGVFIGSSTDNSIGFNDLFIAAPSSGVTSATFKGSYSLAYMNSAVGNGDPASAYDALAVLNPNGAGSAGTMSVTAYSGSSGSTPIPATETNVRYTFSNGVGNMLIPFPAGSGIPGSQVFYISPDGNLVFGGSPGNFDMFVGVRTGAGSPNGLYYHAGILEDESQVTANADVGTIFTYYGSLYAANSGAIFAHQRFFEPIFNGSQDYTYSDSFPAGTPGGYTDSNTSTQYLISADGSLLVGFGIGPFLGIQVAVHAPTFTGTGVFLDPTGIQNAASFAPFTASLSRGELLFLTGSGFADQFVSASVSSQFPNTLGGVQVLINGIPAPLYYVGPTYIAVLVPWETTSAVATIQVVSNKGNSNTVTAFVGASSPGAYIANGYAIAQHTDYSLVSKSNPANPGDTLLVYMTGLGDVSPAIGDGAVGPVPVSTTTNTFTASIGGVSATVAITEIVPTIAGDYVLALTIPTGVPTGDQLLTVSGPDSFTSMALLPIGGAVGAATQSSTATTGGAGSSPAAWRFPRSRQRSASTQKR